MLEAYREHVAERAEQGIVPKPLSAEQVAGLVELLKSPPAGEEEFLMDLLSNRVPAGVVEAAYVKAGFLSAVAKGEAESPLIDQLLAVKLLGTMLGGYNISTLVELLDSDTLAAAAADEGVNFTFFCFFYKVYGIEFKRGSLLFFLFLDWLMFNFFVFCPQDFICF